MNVRTVTLTNSPTPFPGHPVPQITDSFEAIYHKVSPGGMIVVDDCGWDVLPGVQRACDDFLRDKAETLTLVDFPDAVGHGGSTCAAYFTKA